MLSRISAVVRLLLEAHQLDIDDVEALAGLRQEVPQQFVHEHGLSTQRTIRRVGTPVGSQIDGR